MHSPRSSTLGTVSLNAIAAAVLSMLLLVGCGDDANEAPATTSDGVVTTVDVVDGDQSTPGLEPGSNMPPDETPSTETPGEGDSPSNGSVAPGDGESTDLATVPSD